MSIHAIRGIIPPVITPMDAAGEVDTASLRRVVRRMCDADVHGLFALGSSGEVAYLNSIKRRQVLEIIVEESAGKIPVLAGCIDMTQDRVIEAVRVAESLGAQGVVVTAPFYAKNDLHEIADHFRAIAHATELDIWAYDIPARIGLKLPAHLLISLALEGVIKGVKDSSGDDPGFRRLVLQNRTAGNPLSLFSGHEVVVDGMFLLRADGAVPGLANVDPYRYVQLWNASERGDWDQVRQLQDELAALFEIVFQASGRSLDAAGVGAFKVALHHLNVLDSATMAAPVKELDGAARNAIELIVESVGVSSTVLR